MQTDLSQLVMRLAVALAAIIVIAASAGAGGAVARTPQQRGGLPASFPLPPGTRILSRTRVWRTKTEVEYRTLARVPSRFSRARMFGWYERRLPQRGYEIKAVLTGGLSSWQILFNGHNQIGASSVSMAPSNLGGFGAHTLNITLIHHR